MSKEPRDIGRALKSIGDSYVQQHPADAAKVRAGVDRYGKRRFRFAMGGAALVTGAAALIFFLATSSSSPDETLPPAAGSLEIVHEVALQGSPLQVAAKRNIAWVTRNNEGLVSRIEVGADVPERERDIGAVTTDIVATLDGLWVTAPDTNLVRQLSLYTGELIRGWELDGPPGRLSVGKAAIRATVDKVGVVRVDRTNGEQRTIYDGPVIDIAMGEHAFWVLDANGKIVPIDPNTGHIVDGLDVPEVVGEGEVTFLKDALYYGIEGNPTLWRFDESTGLETDRIQLPGGYQDIDADSEGLWALVRDGRLGELVALDPETGAVGDTSLQLEDDPVDIVTGDDGVWVALASGGRVVLVR